MNMTMTKFVIASVMFTMPYVSSARSFGKKDIVTMCKTAQLPTDSGTQFDGKKADLRVLALKAGKYIYPNSGALLLFKSGAYIMKLPQDGRKETFGTDGDDLLAHGGIVGGCSLAQLSEAMQNNSLDVVHFTLVKPY